MLAHLTEEDLICHYYGEPADIDAQAHLDACPECRAAFTALQRTLLAVDNFAAPNPSADFEARTWTAITARNPAIAARPSWWQRLFAPKRIAWAGALAALLTFAFLAGRFTSPRHAPETASAPAAGAVRERLLVAALSDHLEQSERLLLEIDNRELRNERQFAENLLAANRLYRQTAALAGKSSLAATLEDLERVLIDVSHTPDAPSAHQLEQLQARIEDQQLLFKVRVLEQRLRQINQQPIERKG